MSQPANYSSPPELLARLSDAEMLSSTDLKPFPTAAVRALELAQDPTMVPSKIIEVLQSEPIITIRMLQLVNSPRFGLQRQIECLDEAGEYLGCDQLADIATTAAYAAQHSNEGFLGTRQAEYLWRRSVAVALCSASLSSPEEQSKAYLTGLLEGLGLIWILQRLPDRFTRRLHQLVSFGSSAERAQQVLLQTNYCLKSADLLLEWEMPEVYVRALLKLGEGRIDCSITESVAAGRELAAALIERDQVPKYLDWSLKRRPGEVDLDSIDFGEELHQRFAELSELPKAA